MKNKKIFVISGAAIFVCIISLVVVFTSNGSTAAKVSKQLDLGYKYLTDGNYKEAILAFEKAIRIDPKNIEARIALADIYMQTNELDKAEIRLKEVLEIKEDESGASVKLAEVNLLQGDEEEALNILYGVTNRIYYADAYRLLANILIKRGDIEGAVALLKKALTRSNDPEIEALLNETAPMLLIASQEPTEVLEAGQPNEEAISDNLTGEPVQDQPDIQTPAEVPAQAQPANQTGSTATPASITTQTKTPDK